MLKIKPKVHSVSSWDDLWYLETKLMHLNLDKFLNGELEKVEGHSIEIRGIPEDYRVSIDGVLAYEHVYGAIHLLNVDKAEKFLELYNK